MADLQYTCELIHEKKTEPNISSPSIRLGLEYSERACVSDRSDLVIQFKLFSHLIELSTRY